MEDEEGRRTSLGRPVAESRAGGGGTSRSPRAARDAAQMSIRQESSGREVTSPRDDPPAGAIRATRKALIASPSENSFICGEKLGPSLHQSPISCWLIH